MHETLLDTLPAEVERLRAEVERLQAALRERESGFPAGLPVDLLAARCFDRGAFLRCPVCSSPHLSLSSTHAWRRKADVDLLCAAGHSFSVTFRESPGAPDGLPGDVVRLFSWWRDMPGEKTLEEVL